MRAVDSAGSSFTAPSTEIDLAVDTARPGVVLAPLVKRFSLGATSLVRLPRILGLLAAVQASENASTGIEPSVSDEYVEASASTLAAVVPGSLQLFERSDLDVDGWIAGSLGRAILAQIEALIVASWITPSVAGITVDGSAVTAGNGLVPLLAKAVASYAAVRLQPPGAIVLSPARAAWLFLDQSSASGRPLLDLGNAPSVAGIPVLVSGAVADSEVVVADPGEVNLFSSAAKASVYTDVAGQAETLTVTFEAHARAAVVVDFPEATAVVTGLPAIS